MKLSYLHNIVDKNIKLKRCQITPSSNLIFKISILIVSNFSQNQKGEE